MLGTKDAGTIQQPNERSRDRPQSIPHLIFVHGTGAGADTDFGERWWQRGSPFRDELKKRLDLDPGKVVVWPYRWGKGPNFESERRAAGRGLLEELRKLESSGTDYYLVGHSHGGSVIHSALLEGMRHDQTLKGLKMWCTVGTPFLDYRANRWLFQRLNQYELPLYGACWLSLLLAACTMILYLNQVRVLKENWVDLIDITVALTLIGTLGLWAIYRLDKARRTWFSRKQKAALAQKYGDKWLGLYHKEDEAISALDNVRHLDEAIIPRTFLRPFATVIQLTAFALIGLFLLVNTLLDDGTDLSMSLIRDIAEYGTFEQLFIQLSSIVGMEFYDANFDVLSRIEKGIQLLIDYVVFFGVFLSILYVVSLALDLMSRLLSPPISRGLNKLIWSTVRRRSWGDDLVKEDVGTIASHPPEFHERFGPLPEVISAPLRAHADNNAIRALQKVRMVLGMSEQRKRPFGLTSELSETLVWEELIHTSYFRVPEFIDLLALALGRAGLSMTNDGFALGHQERSDLMNWLLEAQQIPIADDPDIDRQSL